MMKRRYLAIVLVAMAALSGCAALDSGGTDNGDSDTGDTGAAAGEFSQDATFAWAGVTGEPVGVEVVVENTGSEEGTNELALKADGETVTSESVTVGAGETETVMLTHAFEETGKYALSVGGSEQTVQVYSSPIASMSGTELERGTRISEERITADGVMVRNGTEFDIQLNETATIRTNYDEQTQYTETETTTNFAGLRFNETSEEWIVNGTAYTRTKSEGERSEFGKMRSDEFSDDDQSLSNPAVLEYLSVEQTDDEYVISFDPEGAEGASEVWGAFGDGEDIPANSITDLTMEYRIDAELFRPNRLVFNGSFEDYDVFSTLDMTVEQEPVAYGEPVDVEVPEQVRENTEPQK
jgi:hypothetical protein